MGLGLWPSGLLKDGSLASVPRRWRAAPLGASPEAVLADTTAHRRCPWSPLLGRHRGRSLIAETLPHLPAPVVLSWSFSSSACPLAPSAGLHSGRWLGPGKSGQVHAPEWGPCFRGSASGNADGHGFAHHEPRSSPCKCAWGSCPGGCCSRGPWCGLVEPSLPVPSHQRLPVPTAASRGVATPPPAPSATLSLQIKPNLIIQSVLFQSRYAATSFKPNNSNVYFAVSPSSASPSAYLRLCDPAVLPTLFVVPDVRGLWRRHPPPRVCLI